MSDALETYSPTLDKDLEDVLLLDLGDVPLDDVPMAPALERIEQAMAHAARVAKLGIMLGGEHTASLAGFRGVAQAYPDAAIIQLDAHLDLRDQYDGVQVMHATWLNVVGEEYGFDRIVQLGLRSGERAEWRRSRERTAWSSTELVLPPHVRRQLESRPVYVSVDIDVLDPAHAPGTGCPEPGGATFKELASFLYGLSGLNVVGLDVMEVAPNLEASNITAAAGAKIVREATLLFGT